MLDMVVEITSLKFGADGCKSVVRCIPRSVEAVVACEHALYHVCDEGCVSRCTARQVSQNESFRYSGAVGASVSRRECAW